MRNKKLIFKIKVINKFRKKKKKKDHIQGILPLRL